MDKNQIKQWLLRYRDGKKDVRRLEEELEELDEMQKNVRGVRYSEMPRGGRKKTDLSNENGGYGNSRVAPILATQAQGPELRSTHLGYSHMWQR